VVIVEVDEVVVFECAFGVGVPVPDVGPFLEQDPMETLDLAVDLRLVRASVIRGDPEPRRQSRQAQI
jgi:hypothetical protein